MAVIKIKNSSGVPVDFYIGDSLQRLGTGSPALSVDSGKTGSLAFSEGEHFGYQRDESVDVNPEDFVVWLVADVPNDEDGVTDLQLNSARGPNPPNPDKAVFTLNGQTRNLNIVKQPTA